MPEDKDRYEESRALDVRVAKAMGFTVAKITPEGKRPLFVLVNPDGKQSLMRYEAEEWVWESSPNYSTEIEHAWRVVEHATRIPLSERESRRMVNTRFAYLFDKQALWACDAQEAAYAICRMYLAAVADADEEEKRDGTTD